MIKTNYFGIFDYIVVVGSLLLPLVLGVYQVVLGRQTPKVLFTGDRSLFLVPVAISITMTYMSATTIIDYPGQVYESGIEIFMMTIIAAFFIPLGCLVFVPVFHDMELTSAYEYLRNRFDSPTVQRLASLTFILQQLLLTTIGIFAAAVALHDFIGLPVWLSIIIIGACGTLYTSMGGLKAVVWAETFQIVIIIAALVAIVSKGFLKSGGFTEAYRIAEKHEKMKLFNFKFDPFDRLNFFNFLIGHGFFTFVMSGSNQLQIQRYSSLENRRNALISVLLSVPLKILVMTLCALAGILIFTANAALDSETVSEFQPKVVSLFVLEELSSIPGMTGLFTAAVFCLALSLFSSPLISLSAVTWNDFLMACFIHNLEESRQTVIARFVGVFHGALIICLALITDQFQSSLNSNLTFSTIYVTYSVLAGLFILGLFFPCSNKFGAAMGLITGLVVMTLLCINAYAPTLVINLIENGSFSNEPLIINETILDHPAFIEEKNVWVKKLSKLSPHLFPVIGSCITIIVGLLISLLTGGICTFFKRGWDKEYLLFHPFLFCRCDCLSVPKDFVSLDISKRYADRITSVHNIYTGSNNRLTTPPNYSYHQYSPVSPTDTLERFSRINDDEVYTELSIASPQSPHSTHSAEYENI